MYLRNELSTGSESMEKLKELNRYQKGLLISMITMALFFAIVYFKTISQVGFAYIDTILIPTWENGSTVYSGKIQGEKTIFTVSEDKTVVFQYGDKTYGPYTLEEDYTAIPKDGEMKEYMTGVELRQGKDILFRGGILEVEDSYWLLYNEDGTLHDFGFTYVTSNGIEVDQNGNVVDSVEPSATIIIELINGPKLTHKGDWSAWYGAVLLCIFNAVSIFFADELFRWSLAFRIRNAERIEPSEGEIVGRYVVWTSMTVMALVVFIMGLW